MIAEDLYGSHAPLKQEGIQNCSTGWLGFGMNWGLAKLLGKEVGGRLP